MDLEDQVQGVGLIGWVNARPMVSESPSARCVDAHEVRLICELLEFINVATAYKIQSQTFRHISFSLENTYQIKVRNVIIGWKTRFVVGTF